MRPGSLKLVPFVLVLLSACAGEVLPDEVAPDPVEAAQVSQPVQRAAEKPAPAKPATPKQKQPAVCKVQGSLVPCGHVSGKFPFHTTADSCPAGYTQQEGWMYVDLLENDGAIDLQMREDGGGYFPDLTGSVASKAADVAGMAVFDFQGTPVECRVHGMVGAMTSQLVVTVTEDMSSEGALNCSASHRVVIDL